MEDSCALPRLKSQVLKFLSMSDPANFRSYLVTLAPDRRAIITIAMQEEVSLPVPLEREEWVDTYADQIGVRTAIAALHSARDLRYHEIVHRYSSPITA